MVSLGGQSFTTSSIAVASGGFSGWMTQTFTFTATGASEALTFLAQGTPTGLPPIAALDGVSLVAVPEPGSIALFAAGLGLLGLRFYHRRAGWPRKRFLPSVRTRPPLRMALIKSTTCLHSPAAISIAAKYENTMQLPIGVPGAG